MIVVEDISLRSLAVHLDADGRIIPKLTGNPYLLSHRGGGNRLGSLLILLRRILQHRRSSRMVFPVADRYLSSMSRYGDRIHLEPRLIDEVLVERVVARQSHEVDDRW